MKCSGGKAIPFRIVFPIGTSDALVFLALESNLNTNRNETRWSLRSQESRPDRRDPVIQFALQDRSIRKWKKVIPKWQFSCTELLYSFNS